jgi:tRNA threonylcarbamoyladenosine biosynthesis protein TsaE
MPILDDRTLEFVSGSPEQTRRLGARLGELLQGGELICLSGDLGTGKTCLAQGLGQGWGADQVLRSPTFTLINEWRRASDAQRLYHADMYRLTSADQAWTLGLEELWNESDVCMIEWPERIAPLLPPERLWIALTLIDDTRRQLRLTADGRRYQALLTRFKRTTFGI